MGQGHWSVSAHVWPIRSRVSLMDHERLERFAYFGGINCKYSLSLLLVEVDQSCCHFVRADRLRCSLYLTEEVE